MMADWQEFKGGEYNERYKTLRVTMNKNGEINLGMRAFERLGRPAAVKLFFDAGGSRIGVKAVPPGEKTFEVVRRTEAHYGMIRGASFCRFYGIRPEGTIVFQDVEMDPDGMMVLDLKMARRLRH